jgi:benzoylformate decarboxylase
VPSNLGALADLLVDTPVGSLAIVAGDEVAASGGVRELVELAEALGAPVFGAALHSTGVFPPTHPLYAGMLAPAAAAINAALSPFRRVLAVGGHTFMVYPYTPGSALPDTVELLHVSPDASRLGRTYPTRLGMVGDPKATLAALLPMVRGRVDAAEVAVAVAAADAKRRQEIDALEETAQSRYASAPMDPMAAGHALVRALPPNTTVIDEAITTGFYVRGFHHWTEPGHYYFCKGGGLGWGMPAALGVSLARDREPVLCVVGDGSAMYSPQALWTAAHEQLPVVFAVVNNRQYLILKGYLRGMGRDSVKADRMVAMDIDEPPVDFVGLARSMGVDAMLVEKAADVGDAVSSALDSGRPHLLELPIAAP